MMTCSEDGPAAATGPGSRLARLGMPVPLEDSATLPAEELASQVTRVFFRLTGQEE